MTLGVNSNTNYNYTNISLGGIFAFYTTTGYDRSIKVDWLEVGYGKRYDRTVV